MSDSNVGPGCEDTAGAPNGGPTEITGEAIRDKHKQCKNSPGFGFMRRRRLMKWSVFWKVSALL